MVHPFSFSFFAQLRWAWYLRMVLVQEEENHKLGIVCVVDTDEGYSRPDLEALRFFHKKMAPAIPLKTSAAYITYSNNAWKQVIDFTQFIMLRIVRVRFRVVVGK
jgi:hypothetical protein